ncbi:DUF4012 domain-containing protein [Amnibacterium sp.]|uniref:DUF4012 domain-containing protein n=1 Tax=Amnibacterium sp. TaxID=1872496 RepID=UPI0026340A82|nr:DUF4012 domain-containing protein [Amnibacterium sp.]MCU1473161.1 hypothetical protein [Amnibacterium sp.]
MLGLGLLALIVCVLWVGDRALVAKNALQQAQGDLTTFKSELGQPGAPSTVALYRRLGTSTATAAKQTDDPVWAAFEQLPWLGPNLKAFRQVAELTDALVRHGVQPMAVAADGISVDSLKPTNGGLDIAPLKKLTPAVASLDRAMHEADASAARIDTTDVVPQLKAPISSLRATLQKAMPLTAELRTVMPVLYPALGGTGTRHYLLIFQNNAEERASGGNPAAMAMLDVDQGKIKLGKQPNSGDFPHPYTTPPLTFSGDWAHVYGPHTSAYVTNITFTPDFPQTARMARAMWRSEFGGTVDGVVSFDPVALSYLMRATGPITLPTGEVLTSDNAVQYLLSGVYAKYTDPTVQNAVFASAAQAIFKAVTSGQGSPKDYVAQLAPMLNEQRLKAWSIRKGEEDLLLTSQAGNMLPADNAKATTFGVYNNDDATSKMSYYMDEKVAVVAKSCPAKAPSYTVAATVTDTLTAAKASGLTSYILAAQTHIPFGGDRQWVQLYGPVGSKLVSATIDGKKVVFGNDQDWPLNTVWNATGLDVRRPAVKGELFGRPVGSVSVTTAPGQSVTVKAVFTGGTTPSPSLAVSHTPKVRPVPVTITRAACG